ncbi:ubiquitin-associated domain-containing protein 2-like [Anneissia japonica]|uniref:ubiquitin-associated domain-containing protein 2-like n=1 Tax=Anneissia japonica TaxID=1529436 RepID=UPI00142559A6|nr:ubiquitin-associated domain-containing protein 2-like [Anneissia japonica]XP_033096101.1 ubiquitin-associated domain-containing protein 2-like [Anneissia japonica]
MNRPSQINNMGFYKTPVCKALMFIIGIPSLILNFTPKLQRYFVYSFSDVTNPLKIWKLLSSKLVFLDVTDLVCGLIILYYFRIFERRAGSRKFSSYILAMVILCTSLEVTFLFMFKFAGYDRISWQPGFQSVLMSLFVKYYLDIPRTGTTQVLGVPFSRKTLTYFMGLQIVFSEPMNAIFALCGIFMGILHRCNVFGIQQWFTIPQSVAEFFSSTLGPVFRSNPPQPLTQPMGATQEIQRQQRLELLEQQMLLAQAQGFMNQNHQRPLFRRRQAFRRRNTHNSEQNQPQAEAASSQFDTDNENQAQQHPLAPQPPEDKIVQLTDMGFSRSEVLDALSVTDNDVSMATNLLLHE